MWEGTEYMLGYGQPTSGDYGAPFLMKATIEDGFMDSWDGCGQWDFELVTTAPASEMTLTTDIATNKHVLNIFDRFVSVPLSILKRKMQRKIIVRSITLYQLLRLVNLTSCSLIL